MVAISAVTTGEFGAVSAGTLGEYKDEKHDSSGSSSSGSTDDDSESDGDDDDDASWDWLWSGDSEENEVDSGSREQEEQVRYTARSCHYRRYQNCMAACGGTKSRCHVDCTARTNEICGAPKAYGVRGSGTGTAGMASPGPSETSSLDVDGKLGGGFGVVEDGALATSELFLGWGTLGVGGQFSVMWNPRDILFETDVGPRLYSGEGAFRYGVQPSLMFSAGNGVDTLAGVGVRSSLHAEESGWFVDARPLVGYIGGNLNVHSRAGVGYYIGEDVYLELGHDFRFVHGLAGDPGVALQGGFLAIGTGH